MLVKGFPQFLPEDNLSFRSGVASSPQWKMTADESYPVLGSSLFDDLDIDPIVRQSLMQLKAISQRYKITSQSTIPPILTIAEIHDLASFVLHSLLQPPHLDVPASISECLRDGICTYMFILHGPTYYSHAAILSTLVVQLQHRLEPLLPQNILCQEAQTWFICMGLVGSIGSEAHEWFSQQAATLSSRFGIHDWELVKRQLESVVWLPNMMCEMVFRESWEAIINSQLITSTVGGVNVES